MQVAAAARERADIAEQRLSQRHEMAQQRDQHALDLLQVLNQTEVLPNPAANITLAMCHCPAPVVKPVETTVE